MLESIDIADVIGLAGIGLAGVVTIICYLRYPRLALLLGTAYAARAGAALFHYFVRPLPEGSLDAEGFQKQAVAWAGKNLVDALGNFGEWGMSWIYANVMSLVVLAVGHAPLLLQSFSVIAGVLTVVFTYRLALQLWEDERFARKAAWVATLFPSLVLYSALTLREAFITMLFVWALIYVVRWAQTGLYRHAIVAFALLGLQLFLHAGMVLAAIAFAGIIAFTTVRTVLVRLGRGYIRVIPTMVTVVVVVALTLFWVQLAGMSLPYIGALAGAFSTDILVQQALNVQLEAGSAWPRWLLPDSTLGVIVLTPFRMLYLMYSPFPWDVRSPAHVIGLFDAVLYIGISVAIWRNRATIKSSRAAKTILLMLIPLVLAFAWGTGNSGTALRHRSKILIALVMLAGTRLPRIRFDRPKP